MHASGTGHRPIESAQPRPIPGVHRDDLLPIGAALSGLHYPVERWELLEHATGTLHATDSAAHPDSRTIRQLWTLPNCRYHNLDEVFTALARTARGHPPRRGTYQPAGSALSPRNVTA